MNTQSNQIFQNILKRAIHAVKIKQYLNMINKDETKEVLDRETYKAIDEFIVLAKPFSLEVEGIKNRGIVECVYITLETTLKSDDYMKMFHDYYFSGKIKK